MECSELTGPLFRYFSLSPQDAAELVLAWLKEPYDGGRHQARVDKIMALDRK